MAAILFCCSAEGAEGGSVAAVLFITGAECGSVAAVPFSCNAEGAQ